jgi:signal peptidase I
VRPSHRQQARRDRENADRVRGEPLVNKPEISQAELRAFGALNSVAVEITRDPRRLEALCELWKGANRSVWLTLSGYSMAPTLLPGTRLKVRCGIAPSSLGVGEIVVFRNEDSLVIHRLVAVGNGEPKRYTCKGDNNPDCDTPITGDRIIGRVVEIRPPAALTRLRKRLGHLLLSYRRRAASGRRERNK